MPELRVAQRRTRRHGHPHSRGLATLTVVMLLFMVLAMVAAYTGRNLVFEQRTAVNQLRSTQAIEVAQAGVEWAVAMLNGGRITDQCAVSTNPAHASFRDRNLAIDAGNGALTVANAVNGAACVLTSTGWTCHCPNAGTEPSVAAPADAAVSPAFRLRFVNETNPVQSMVRVEVNACTRVDSDCLNQFPGKALEQDGRITVYALVALKGAVAAAPTAAITSRAAASVDGRAINTDADAGGITVASGSTVTVADLSKVQSIPGSPASGSLVSSEATLSDATLQVTGHSLNDRMFASVFGMAPNTYKEQPAAIVLTCPVGGCSAATVRTQATNHPGRPIWIDGNFVVDDSDAIGSPTRPLVLVVNGELELASGGTIFGLVYGRSAASPPVDWQVTGGGAAKIYGALVAEQGLAHGAANSSVVFDRDILRRLRLTQGSFVVVPGSWRDFQ